MIRAVLDTNVYVSGVIRTSGPPTQIIHAWRDHQIDLLVSPSIIQEIERVFRYPRIQRLGDYSEEEIVAFLRSLRKDAIWTEERVTITVVKEDPDDNKFLACAVEGHADFVVTGDRHLLSITQYESILIITPREMVDILINR